MTLNIKHNKKRVLFRADGDSKIGLGHIYRCLAIAERLNEHFDCYFAIRQPSNELKDQICKYSNLIVLNQYEDYEFEVEDILASVILNYKIDIITLDGYYFNTNYQKKIKELCNKCVLISIDDYQPFHYVSDIVINHAGGVDASIISKEPYTLLFLGYDYLLLRNEFIKTLSINRKIVGINSVLICFGGADPDDFTKKITDCLKCQKNIKKIIIVLGSSYSNKEILEQSIHMYSHITIMNNLNAETLAEVMINTDLAIVPSSTIGLEAFASKMIMITGMTANNQESIYNGLVKEDTVIGVDFQQLTCDSLLKNIYKASIKYLNYTAYCKSSIDDSVLKMYKSI